MTSTTADWPLSKQRGLARWGGGGGGLPRGPGLRQRRAALCCAVLEIWWVRALVRARHPQTPTRATHLHLSCLAIEEGQQRADVAAFACCTEKVQRRWCGSVRRTEGQTRWPSGPLGGSSVQPPNLPRSTVPPRPAPPTRVCVNGDLLAAQERDGHLQHHHPSLKPVRGGARDNGVIARSWAGELAAVTQHVSWSPACCSQACYSPRRLPLLLPLPLTTPPPPPPLPSLTWTRAAQGSRGGTPQSPRPLRWCRCQPG